MFWVRDLGVAFGLSVFGGAGQALFCMVWA